VSVYNYLKKYEGSETLEEMISNFLAEEVLDDFRCEHCKQKGTSTKRMIILKFPKIFIFHLVRFEMLKLGNRMEQ